MSGFEFELKKIKRKIIDKNNLRLFNENSITLEKTKLTGKIAIDTLSSWKKFSKNFVFQKHKKCISRIKEQSKGEMKATVEKSKCSLISLACSNVLICSSCGAKTKPNYYNGLVRKTKTKPIVLIIHWAHSKLHSNHS